MAQLRLISDIHTISPADLIRNTIKSLPVFGESPRVLLDAEEVSSATKLPIDEVKNAIKTLEREGYIARMFKGRRSKTHVYALLNPSLKGTAMEVWV